MRRKLIELHEEIDEVNYFLNEWQRLISSEDTSSRIIAKPEVRFVAHAIERVISEADNLDVPLVLKTGNAPLIARQDKRLNANPKQRRHRNWLIPSSSTIELTDYRKFTDAEGNLLTFVGNRRGFLPLRKLAETIASGGELRIAGTHAGDWSA